MKLAGLQLHMAAIFTEERVVVTGGSVEWAALTDAQASSVNQACTISYLPDICNLRRLSCLTRLHMEHFQESAIPTITESLPQLRDLAVLFGNNGVVSWEGMHKLTCLQKLTTNAAMDLLPTEICSVVSLQELMICSSVGMSGVPDAITQLTALETLHIDSFATGHFPAAMCQIVSLRNLKLSLSMISKIPSAISGLTALTTLVLIRNRFAEFPREICSIRSLSALMMDSNQIAVIPCDITRLTNLNILDLTSNRIVEIPDHLRLLPVLQTLYFDGNPLVRCHVSLFTRKSLYISMQKPATPPKEHLQLYGWALAAADDSDLRAETRECLRELLYVYF